MADIIPAYKTGIERLGMITSQRFNEVAKFAFVQTIGSGRLTIYVSVQPIGLVVFVEMVFFSHMLDCKFDGAEACCIFYILYFFFSQMTYWIVLMMWKNFSPTSWIINSMVCKHVIAFINTLFYFKFPKMTFSINHISTFLLLINYILVNNVTRTRFKNVSYS